jgi:Fem-1 family protein b
MFHFRYPCVHTTRLLLQCGVDVNAIDAVRNTPLHIFAGNRSTEGESMLTLLCDAGAHLDYVNALGEMPIDVASDSTVKQLLKSRMKLSLKCLCARFIQKNSVPFHDRIATSLVSFVEKH